MKTTLVILCMCCFHLSHSQKLPEFGIYFYFEDAQGNRDTVFAGFDSTANDSFNPDFGEVYLNEPFKHPLDVRLSRNYGTQLPFKVGILSKRLITSTEYVTVHNKPWLDCNIGEPIMFFVKANHFPVTMRWDPNEFWLGSKCVQNSYMTSDQHVEIIDPIEAWIRNPNKRFTCLSLADYYSFNLESDYTRQNFPNELSYQLIKSYPDHPSDTVYGIKLFHQAEPYYSPCKVWVSDETVVSPELKLSIYPNPAAGWISIQYESDLQMVNLAIFDVMGHCVRKWWNPQPRENFDLQNLPEGLYVVTCQASNGIQGSRLLVVQH